MKNKYLLHSDNSIDIDGEHIEKSERQECEVYTRCMGYFRPVAFFNVGKKGEFHERVEFVEPTCGCLS